MSGPGGTGPPQSGRRADSPDGAAAGSGGSGGLRALATRAAIVSGVVLLVAAAAALVMVAAQVLLLIFAGLLFAVLLGAATDALVRVSSLPHGLALAIVVAALAAALAGGAVALWPSISAQADQLATELPAALGDLRQWFEQREWGRWLLGRADSGRLADGSAVMSQAAGAVLSTVNAVVGLLVILFVGLYVAAQPQLYRRGLIRLTPPRHRERIDDVLCEVTGVLQWWLLGKLLSMTLVGVLTTVGLWWLGVPLALTFGLLAAALTFIPNFGPVLAVAPPAILALADDPRQAAYVVALYLAIQTVESYGVTPLIQRRTVSMPPAMTITAQVVLGVLVGMIGVAVATPLTAAVMTVVRKLYVEDFLEDGAPTATASPSSGTTAEARLAGPRPR